MSGGDDVLDDAFQVVQHFCCRETERLDALRQNPNVAGFVALGAVTIFVRFAIDFDRQFEAGAEEVEDIGSSGVLVTEA